MKPTSRILIAVSALLLAVLFAFPMWKIYLDAPQYPEGLEMHIWINKIGGDSEFTLQNFNILNHYIGMAEINESSFKELKYMPWIVMGLIGLGLLSALLGFKKFMLGWVILLTIACTAGLLDFYLWLHEFGTNLDPTAPIKVPGMTYIPPLIGSKSLLSFQALSIPGIGGMAVAASLLIGFLVIYLEFFKNKMKSYEKRKHIKFHKEALPAA